MSKPEPFLSLYMSRSLSPAFFLSDPFFVFPPRRYRILDASESNVFVEVDHGHEASLYTSGPHGLFAQPRRCFVISILAAAGTNFALSLKQLRRAHDGNGDLIKIAGIDGVYVSRPNRTAALHSCFSSQLHCKRPGFSL